LPGKQGRNIGYCNAKDLFRKDVVNPLLPVGYNFFQSHKEALSNFAQEIRRFYIPGREKLPSDHTRFLLEVNLTSG
jgi:hypothetical protein